MSISRLALCSGGGETWDIGFAQYSPPENLSWDLATATFSQTLSIAALETVPKDVFFKPDGLKMYVVGDTGNTVYGYNLSTAWDVTTAVFSQGLNLSSQETNPTSLFFKPDGTKLYVIGTAGDDVNEYNLSTAWNITTATFSQSFSVAAQEIAPSGLFFKPDGLKMYVLGLNGQDVNEYNLSAAWDVSTAIYSQNFSVATQAPGPTGLFFKSDGLKMYVVDLGGDEVNEYNLSTAWNITTATFSKVFFLTPTLDWSGLFFSPEGGRMYVIESGASRIYQYTLGGFSVRDSSFVINNTSGLFFKPDGTKMYVTTSVGGLYEYNLSAPWDTSTATFSQYSVVTGVRIGDLYFRSDGLKMYITGGGGSGFENFTLREFSLSVAWDTSTAGSQKVFDWSTGATSTNYGTGLSFKDDGTTAYIAFEPVSNRVRTFTLSTPWDISTISGATATETVALSPKGLFFRSGGSKFYVVSDSSDNISEYDLTTPYLLSTKVLNQTFSLFSEGPSPQGVFFRPDGKAFYTIDELTKKIYQYSIG